MVLRRRKRMMAGLQDGALRAFLPPKIRVKIGSDVANEKSFSVAVFNVVTTPPYTNLWAQLASVCDVRLQLTSV